MIVIGAEKIEFKVGSCSYMGDEFLAKTVLWDRDLVQMGVVHR